MLHDDILQTVDAIDLVSRNLYCIDGALRDFKNVVAIAPRRASAREGRNSAADPAGTKDTLNPALDNILATDIYKLLYQSPRPITAASGTPLDQCDYFKSQLSAANCGTGTWEDGWQIVKSDIKNNQIAVKKNNIVFWVTTDEVKCQGKHDASMACRVRIPKEAANLDGGYFTIYGNYSSVGCKAPVEDVVAFYWNLTAKGAPDFVRYCTSALNEERLHFRVRMLSDPRTYQRSDAAILTINRADLAETLPILQEIHHKLSGEIRSATPMFCRRIAGGLGFAEEPRDDSSFGYSRSKIIAEALTGCLTKGHVLKGKILQAVQQSFEEHGIDPMAPYALKEHVSDYEQVFDAAMGFSMRRQEKLT
jgi:hypothetical protein